MNAMHLHLPHFHHTGKPRLMLMPLPEFVPPWVADVSVEPDKITFYFNDGTLFYIWTGRHSAHRANLHLPDGRIIYLSAGKPSLNSMAEHYLRQAYRYVEGCIQDYAKMITHLPLRDSSIQAAHMVHEQLKTPFIWDSMNYDTR